MCNGKRFSIDLDVYKFADLDNAKVSYLNANECRKDGLESKYVENVRVQKGERRLCQLLMAGAKLIGFTGNFTLRLSKAPSDLKNFSFSPDIINEKRCECGVWGSLSRGTRRTLSTTWARRGLMTETV